MNVKNRRTYEELILPLPSLSSTLFRHLQGVQMTYSNPIQILYDSTQLLLPKSDDALHCSSPRLPETRMTLMINEPPDYYFSPSLSHRFSYQIWHLLLPNFLPPENDTLFLRRPRANCRIPLSNHAREVGEEPWVEEGREFEPTTSCKRACHSLVIWFIRCIIVYLFQT